MRKQYFEERKSKLKRLPDERLGAACAPYLVQG